MPLGAGNIIQVVTGSTGSTAPISPTITVTAAATQAGNSLVLCFTTAATAPDAPTGFTELRSQGNLNAHLMWIKSNVSADETSWDVVLPFADSAAWVLYEISSLAALPYDSSASNGSNTGSASWSSGTTGGSAASDTIVIASFAGELGAASGALGTWGSYTNSFVEDGENTTTRPSTGNNVNIAAAHLFPGVTGSFESTATQTVTPDGQTGLIVALKSSNSPLTDPLVMCYGAETGTLIGGTVGNTGNKVFDVLTGSMSIQTGSAHAGGVYCLRATAAGAAANMQWNTNTCGSTMHRVHRIWIRVISCTGTAQIATSDTSPSNGVVFSYNSSTSRIEALCEAGTTQTSSMTIGLNTWFMLEWYSNFSGTQYIVQWRVNGIAQTDALSQTGLTAQNVSSTYFGTFAGDTITVEFDDVAISATAGDWPIGDGKVVGLLVDPAGTLTLTGTAANFNTFTNNGTLAAWNATTARNAIDEVPPTIGATADGFVQVNLATSDYVEIPMTTYTLAAGEFINGLRMLTVGWATSTTAATIGFSGWDGSAATVLQAGTVDPNFDNSTTAPAWVCKMFLPSGGWNQTKLNALAFRVGFSSDASPDIGIHAIYAEADIGIGAVGLSPPFRPTSQRTSHLIVR